MNSTTSLALIRGILTYCDIFRVVRAGQDRVFCVLGEFSIYAASFDTDTIDNEAESNDVAMEEIEMMEAFKAV